MRTAERVSVGLLAALWAGSVLAWPRLPARIPVHFSFGGGADRWEETTLLSWFGLPLLALAAVLLNALLARALPKRPGLVNLPDKKRFLALPPEYRAPVVRRIQDSLHALGAQVVLLFGLMQVAVYRTAAGADTRTYMLFVLVYAVALLPVLALWGASGLQAELTRQLRRHREEAGPGE